MTKQILIFVSLTLFVALITTGSCSGPIDQIFVHWRDTTGCTIGGSGGGWNCFPSSIPSSADRDAGIAVLVFLSFLLALFYGLFRLTRRIWRKLGKE